MKLGSLYLLFIGFVSIQLNAQNRVFKYQPLPKEYVGVHSKNTRVAMSLQENKESYFDLTKVLPRNFVKDASVDYTSYIQKGLNNYRKVLMPNFPILVNGDGLEIKSNSEIFFQSESKILLKPTSLGTYNVLKIHNVSNISIFDPKIVGDRKAHKGSEGQWGMGIGIRSANNILIVNPQVSACWGDGIYIGRNGAAPSTNIKITNAYLDYNRRNGISITSVNGLTLTNPIVCNTEGTLPMAGICIEPNNNKDEIANIAVENPITYNNYRSGVVIGLGKLVGPLKKSVSISVKNHVDDKSEVGLYMGGIPSAKERPGLPLQGKIQYFSPKWLNSAVEPLKTRNSYSRAPKLEISNMSISRPASKVNYIERIKKNYKNSKDISIR